MCALPAGKMPGVTSQLSPAFRTISGNYVEGDMRQMRHLNRPRRTRGAKKRGEQRVQSEIRRQEEGVPRCLGEGP